MNNEEKDIFIPETEDLEKAEEIGDRISPYFTAVGVSSGFLMILMTCINILF